MPPEPGSIFGGLLARCIRDVYVKDDSRLVAEGVVFLIFGAASSVATTYLLASVGVLL